MFYSPFSIAITSLGEERASLGAFRTFVRFALVWFCLFPLPLGVWEGLRFVIVALPGLFSYPFLIVTEYWAVQSLVFEPGTLRDRSDETIFRLMLNETQSFSCLMQVIFCMTAEHFDVSHFYQEVASSY